MVYVFLADGFEEIEALSVVDILRRAGVSVATVGVTGEVVMGSHNISVISDIKISEVKKPEIEAIVLPGGVPGTPNLKANKSLLDILAFARESDILTCAICAAPSILGELGYLKGVRATCYPGFEDTIELYENVPVIRDGNIITGRAAGSAHLFAFEILKALKGCEEADKVFFSMIY